MENSLIINTIYLSYQGEVNVRGIGAPVIFIRTQGCHLRCYKDTLGTLCDTPEALEMDSNPEKRMTIPQILERCNHLRKSSGVNLICLTGGDPLYNSVEALTYLFTSLTESDYVVSVETSGTLPVRPIYVIPNVHWVLDWKSKSAGLKTPFHESNLALANSWDKPETMIIKFVIHDMADFIEMVSVIPQFINERVIIAAGVYWGSNTMSATMLFNSLRNRGLLGRVRLNMQAHKLITMSEFFSNDINHVIIPREL